MITEIEKALVQRLQLGLGRMVREVTTYAGELDDDPGRIVHRLPAAWVTFGGITETRRHSTSRQKYVVTGRFMVVVGDYNTRNEQATRHGGANLNEVGTNLLIKSVRRLLTGQDLGLDIDYIEPGRVRTLFNTRTQEQAFSVFACEFDTRWMEKTLENGRWPERTLDPDAPDAPFNRYAGTVSDPDPELTTIGMTYFTDAATAETPAASDIVELKGEEDNEKNQR